MLSLLFVNIYINSPAVWCFTRSLDYHMIELTEIEPIFFYCIYSRASVIREHINNKWNISISVRQPDCIGR